MPDKEFLVFVEDEEDGDDRLVFEKTRPGRELKNLELQPEIDVRILNRGSRLATTGLAFAVLGALLGTVALVVFAIKFPGEWRLADGAFTYAPSLTSFLGAIAGLCLIAGAVLTPLGRRIEARGMLRSVRVVEKADA